MLCIIIKMGGTLAAHFSVHLFGYPQFFVDDRPVKVERKKTLALAAYLAIETGLSGSPNRPGDAASEPGPSTFKVCGREALAALFWPDCPAEKALAYLRQAVWDFTRAAGEEWLVKDHQSIGLNPKVAVDIDVSRFRAMFTRQNPSLQSEVASTAALLELNELYRNDFLAGFTLPGCPNFDEWQTLHTETLRLQITIVLEELVDRFSNQRDYDQAIHHALRWLSLDPLNETCSRILMTLYLNNNQRASALAQYETCASRLKNELGIEPSHETIALYRRIRDRITPAMPPERVAQAAQEETAPASMPDMARPTGTVTFLFTDIEGSTRLWESHPQAMAAAHKRQEEIVRQAMARQGGYVYKMIGDAFQVAFSTAPQALRAAVAAQRDLAAEPWGEVGSLKVRMALHTGVTEERADDYVGPTLNRVARVLSAGHGGQILVNQPAYEQLRDLLPEGIAMVDLGENYLKDLTYPEHLYQVSAVSLPQKFPPLRTLALPARRLPPQPTPFVGREAELAEIETALADPGCRLLTLAGIGGMGKTRLAIQAASQTQAFNQDIVFVGLEGVDNRPGLMAAMADAVGLGEKSDLLSSAAPDAGLTARLSQYLSTHPTLLLLDNFEQLAGDSEVLSSLLEQAKGLKLLVTSRERLNLPVERVMDVAGLAYPGNNPTQAIAQYPAASLFIASAERASGFRPQPADWPAITRICQYLEGVPLGIEMAASWTRLLSCQDIAAEVEKSLDFLTSSWRGMPERHRTIRAVFETTWTLLFDPEKRALVSLTLFKGGFSREAALAVTGITLPVLLALVDKSLVRRQSSDRYELHPLLTQYAAEKLAAIPELSAALQERYCAYYGDWIFHMERRLQGGMQLETLNTMRADAKNLATLWQMLVRNHDYAQLTRLTPGAIAYFELNNRFTETTEMTRLLSDLIPELERVAGDESQWPTAPYAPLLALSLAAFRHFSRSCEDPKKLSAMQRKSVQIAQALPDGPLKALCLVINASGPEEMSLQEDLDLLHQSIRIYEQLDDAWGIALARLVLGDTSLFSNHDLESSRDAYMASLALFEAAGNEWGQGKCLYGLATILQKEGRLAEAFALGERSLRLFERLNSTDSILYNRTTLADIAEAMGENELACPHLQALLAHYHQAGNAQAEASIRDRLDKLYKMEYHQESVL